MEEYPGFRDQDSGVRRRALRTRQPERQRTRAALRRRTTSPHADTKEKKNSLKLHELCGNVYENKGSAFHGPGQSGNLIENKSGYALNAGMSLKLKVVSTCQIAGEGRPVASLPLLAVNC